MFADTVGIAAVLGIKGRQSGSLMALANGVEAGLPIATFDRIVAAVAPHDPDFANRLIPRSTVARRRADAGARLTVDEGSRVARLAKVWAFARHVWRDDDDARRFLARPHPMLDDRPPREVAAASDPGAEAVINLIGRGAYGGGV